MSVRLDENHPMYAEGMRWEAVMEDGVPLFSTEPISIYDPNEELTGKQNV